MPCRFVDEYTGECLHPHSNPGDCPYNFPDECPYGEYKLVVEHKLDTSGLLLFSGLLTIVSYIFYQIGLALV